MADPQVAASVPVDPSKQPTASRPTRLGDIFREAAAVWLAGVRDALTLHECVFFLARSETIRFRTLQCFMLNGVIFLGSIILFNWVIDPALAMLRHLVKEDEVWATEFVGASLSALYKVLWIYPIYCISFVLNTVMYQEVADSALALRQSKPWKAMPPLERLINEAFRVLLNLVYIIEMDLIYYLPVVGPALYFVHSCWLASIYCFEYRWVHLRWTSNARLEYFERHWLYFAGFGFPVSCVSFLCPRFIDAGVFALLFPLSILTAIVAEPRALRLAPRHLRRLPVFLVVQGTSCLMLRMFETRLGSPGDMGLQPRDQPKESAAAESAAVDGRAKGSPARERST